MHQLRFAVGLGPGQVAALFDQRQKGGQEGATDILRKGKVGLPVAGVQIVKENPPHPARPAPVRHEKVFVRPGLEFRIVGGVMPVARGLQHRVEMGGILGVFEAGVKVGATAEPRRPRGPEHPGVKVNRRRVRVLHMRHQADPAGPEARIIGQPRHPPPRHRALRFFAKGAMHLADVDPDLLEHAACAHHAHQPAAAIGAGGRRHLEPPRRAGPAVAVFQPFERGHDLIAQGSEPGRSTGFAGIEIITHRGFSWRLPLPSSLSRTLPDWLWGWRASALYFAPSEPP